MKLVKVLKKIQYSLQDELKFLDISFWPLIIGVDLSWLQTLRPGA